MTKIFRPNPNLSACTHGDRGFSLLEILIVLAIMGLLLSVVSVRLFSMIESTQFIRQSESTLAKLKSHRADALLEKHALTIVTDDIDTQYMTTRPARHIRQFNHTKGWSVKGSPVFITRGGVCRGGPLTFSNGKGRKITYILHPPNCRAERVTDGLN